MSDETNRPEGHTPAPESFPPELLAQPVGARLEYFEQRCLISHPRLQEALETIIQAICPPGERASTRRPGTMVLVIGPSRVGKTTLIRLLEEQLLARTKALMASDPNFIPFASILAAGPGTNRFEWAEYYRAVLRSLHDPFVDGKIARIRTKELREAMETALLERKLLAIIVDEAHHLAEAASGSRLQSQLNHLKHFENATGVSHILVGTYEMRPFRKVNAPRACRSVDLHFPRYDATIERDAQVFQSVVWALQRQLPVEKEPPLLDHWEFLYARSIGCIGLLKTHLNRALNLALAEEAKTLPPREQFFMNLSKSCEERGEQSRLAELTGLARGQFARWLRRSCTPTLQSLLEFCYVCNVTPLQILRGDLASLRQVIQEGKPYRPPRARRPVRPLDREHCLERIQAILDGREEPLGYVQLAQQLGHSGQVLLYHFPQECALLSQHFKEHGRQRKEQRLAQVQEEVRQAMLALHAQWIYPSQNKVADLLSDPNLLFQPEAKATWRALCRELGWDRKNKSTL